MRKFGRVLTVLALALPLGGLVATPAGAAAKPATCTKAVNTSNLKTGVAKSVLSGCTGGPSTGATSVSNFKVLTNITTTITWNGGGGKNGPFKITEKAGPKTNTCKSETVKGKSVKDALIVSTGTVSSGTGKAASLKGTKFAENLCVTQTSSTYLEPGSKVTV